jgi:hypothetical protein
VERRYPHLSAVNSEQRLDTGPHLFSRLIGEGDRKNPVRPGDAVTDEMRDAVRNDPRLTRARAGKDQKGPIGLKNGFLLFGIETREQIQVFILPSSSDVTLGDLKVSGYLSALPLAAR